MAVAVTPLTGVPSGTRIRPPQPTKAEIATVTAEGMATVTETGTETAMATETVTGTAMEAIGAETKGGNKWQYCCVERQRLIRIAPWR
jgi:hypothetical protein